MSVQCIKILKNVVRIKTINKVSYSTSNAASRNDLIISCKRRRYNLYTHDVFDKLDEVPLASKGWNHNKSKDDYFTIRPINQNVKTEMVPFTDIGIHPNLIEALNNSGIKEATPFQAEAIAKIEKRGHTLLAAETGCGKTIAYLLPVIQNLIGERVSEMNTPRALILAPNRELAFQIGEVAQQLAQPFDLKVKVVVGGRTKKVMLNPEFSDLDILVGTPGALGKLSAVGVFRLNKVLYTVLDEADTLLDDSFVERMAGIVRKLPHSQMILVSATLPKNLPDIMKPIEETLEYVTSPNLHKPLLNITQRFCRLTKSNKPASLLRVVKKFQGPMLVFTNKNETCNWLAMYLRENGFNCANINGDMNYALRIEQWNDFVQGKARILSATDIASRGLNTIQVDHVLNYDFPLYTADYLHRIGRTGRLGSPEWCMVTNFISTPLEVKIVQEIELAIRKGQALTNIDGNIPKIVQKKIMRKMQQATAV